MLCSCYLEVSFHACFLKSIIFKMLFANRFSKFFYHKWKHFAIVVWKLLQNTLTTAGKIYYILISKEMQRQAEGRIAANK